MRGVDLGIGVWVLALCLGLVAGAAAAMSIQAALGITVLAVALYVYARSSVQSEVVVAIYWFTFCIFSTVFASVSISGFYFPFYGAFLVAIMGGLLGTGLRVVPRFVLAMAAFLVIALVALLGYDGTSNFEAFQRLLAYALGLIILLQFRSARGLQPVLLAIGAASLVISGWVIWNAAQTGFAYRAGLDVNQNVVTLFIGFGLVAVFSIAVEILKDRRSLLLVPLLLIAFTVMAYAVLLLASRGMTIALIAAIMTVLVRTVLRERRMLLVLLPLAAVLGLGFLLPGGHAIVERFGERGVESGNERLPIWEATLDSFASGNIREIVLGHGFDSSRAVVQERFGSLTSTHNTYLQILYEFGIIGLALFTFLHAYLLVQAWRTRGPYGLVMLGIMAFLVTTNLAMSAADGFLYWTAIGFAAALGMWAPSEPARGGAGA